MSIKDELADELKDAMLSKDGPRRDVIRQIVTEISMVSSDPGFDGEVNDALYEKVIASYVKKMDKSREEYESYGDRGEAMAAKLGFEVDYLRRWLPQTLDEPATRTLVANAISALGVEGDEKSAGRVIGHIMKTHGNDVDGGLVNRIVREDLSPS